MLICSLAPATPSPLQVFDYLSTKAIKHVLGYATYVDYTHVPKYIRTSLLILQAVKISVEDLGDEATPLFITLLYR